MTSATLHILGVAALSGLVLLGIPNAPTKIEILQQRVAALEAERVYLVNELNEFHGDFE